MQLLHFVWRFLAITAGVSAFLTAVLIIVFFTKYHMGVADVINVVFWPGHMIVLVIGLSSIGAAGVVLNAILNAARNPTNKL
jgi:hypothetical protein